MSEHCEPYSIDDGYMPEDLGKGVIFMHPDNKFRIVCKCRNGSECAHTHRPLTDAFWWNNRFGLPRQYDETSLLRYFQCQGWQNETVGMLCPACYDAQNPWPLHAIRLSDLLYWNLMGDYGLEAGFSEGEYDIDCVCREMPYTCIGFHRQFSNLLDGIDALRDAGWLIGTSGDPVCPACVHRLNLRPVSA